MAWLNATPKPPEGSKAADPRFKRPELSRLDQYKEDKVPVLMPPNPAPKLIKRLLEIGITEPTGMGSAALSWVTLAAWQQCTGGTLRRWEGPLLRRLSQSYVTESRLAEDATRPPPWRAKVTDREREIEQAQLEKVLG